MNNLRIYLAWVSTFSLIGAPIGLEGCGAKENQPAQVVQQAAPASQDAAVGTPVSNQQQDPAQQGGQQQTAGQQQQPIQLPDVNLTPAGLDELLAPIALYPDPVLAVLLQASVDPQQVMDGGNWLTLDQNQNLKEAALDQASAKAGFTPVMQALLHYPSVIDMMCTQFDWTKQLGAAYSADPKAVLGSVQRLRAIAVDNGALKSSDQMKVNVKQDQGQEIVELAPANPKVVYVPQYDPTQVFSTTTTTTNPDGSSTTTTTTSGPATTSSSNSTVVVQQQSSGVSTGSAVLIGLLSFGAGIAVGAAINSNNYYYPAWGYGGVYYGGRPYYPPPYHPYYGGGWGPSYGYNRPVHYGNNNIYINNNRYNNNYYNRFNNNSNLKPNYKPMPVHYNNKPNGVYANSMGNKPGYNQSANYTRPNKGNGSGYQGNAQNRPGNQGGNNSGNSNARPGNKNNGQPGSNVAQRPGNNTTGGAGNNNWKGQSSYQGNKGGANGNAQTRPGGGANSAAPNTRPGGASGGGQPNGNNKFGNANVDRGFGNQSGGRQNTASPAARPSTGNAPANRPATSNQMSRPAASPQPAARPQQQSKPGGAFGGASNPSADRSASNRGRQSMGAPQHSAPSKPAAKPAAAPKNVKRN